MDGLIIIQFRRATCYFYQFYHTFKTKIKIGKKMQYENDLRFLFINKIVKILEKNGGCLIIRVNIIY